MPAADVALTRDVDTIALELPGRPEPMLVTPHHMHDAGVIDPETRALTVQFEVENRGNQLLIGQTGTALLYGRAIACACRRFRSGGADGGRPSVRVRADRRRALRAPLRRDCRARTATSSALKSGVMPGERVVTRGAYDVQLASAAKGLPAEGHVH